MIIGPKEERTSRFMDSVTLSASDLGALSFDSVRALLAQHNIVRVRGLFDRAEVLAAKAAVAARFDPALDRRHDPRDTESIRTNFQKLQIGANSGIDTRRTLGRFLRILYNPLFADDIYGLRALFARLCEFRNRLYGLRADYATWGTEDGLWTCARLHQYPRGGGFMVPHRDMYSRAATVTADLGYFQPFLLLSEQGTDYQEGGAYIDLAEERIHYEAACLAGDVIVYDGRTIHGVADVDPLAPLELSHFTGRVAAFVSLYRHLAPGDAGYSELGRAAREGFGPDETER
jgi:hypothetical protein